MYFLIELIGLIYTVNRINRVESSIDFYAMNMPVYPVRRPGNRATLKTLVNIAKATLKRFSISFPRQCDQF